jgi:hypothetical protein
MILEVDGTMIRDASVTVGDDAVKSCRSLVGPATSNIPYGVTTTPQQDQREIETSDVVHTFSMT